ncbi:uncharacterized protein BP5553_01654 [Venustampulla echinocandica]|uniref:SRR1-like domain-containing protein n=1 Tax=Venustampulla echinocandica TaxID=2656787 RepID=A0A370U1N0_9HELO|nr:uncharacterized protein BP5553_01654 [Venustampulla echinocandica]RDL41675.1 hypothetical protein BP5553_01654 [Venustampulla echinocandica]
MPHTNRKKKTPAGMKSVTDQNRKQIIVHTKRKEVLDDEGWTHVVDKPSRQRASSVTESKDAGKYWSIGADFKVGDAYYINRTIEEIQEEFTHSKKAWEGSPACASLKALLDEKMKADSNTKKISRVVALGLGSLQSSRTQSRKTSFTQMAALETILQIMAKEETISMIFQDPVFTDLDKEFLVTLGHQVVEDPAAFDQIDENTLVYAIHCYSDVYQKVSQAPKPAVLVSTDVELFDRTSLDGEKGDVKSLGAMVESYEAIPFPQIRHDFSDTKIYWPKNVESGNP